jgi:PTH1 family peptidyl-tRNA hydrolase
LRDIIAHIGSRDFYRLRVGIGRPLQGSSVADYVLSNPPKATFGVFESIFDVLNQRLDLLLQADIAAVNAALPALSVKN